MEDFIGIMGYFLLGDSLPSACSKSGSPIPEFLMPIQQHFSQF